MVFDILVQRNGTEPDEVCSAKHWAAFLPFSIKHISGDRIKYTCSESPHEAQTNQSNSLCFSWTPFSRPLSHAGTKRQSNIRDLSRKKHQKLASLVQKYLPAFDPSNSCHLVILCGECRRRLGRHGSGERRMNSTDLARVQASLITAKCEFYRSFITESRGEHASKPCSSACILCWVGDAGVKYSPTKVMSPAFADWSKSFVTFCRVDVRHISCVSGLL